MKNKTYTITRRFSAWLTVEVSAANFAEAVKQGEALNSLSDFVDIPVSTVFLDSEILPGFGVSENF